MTTKNAAAAATIHDILSEPTRLLSTILIGNTIVNVAIAALGFSIAEHYFPSHGEIVAIPIVTVLVIILAEAAPKRLGLLHAEVLALAYAPALKVLILVLTPVRMLLERITKTFEPIFRPHGRTLSEEEFETVLDISGEEGILNPEELAMIKSIIRLEDLKASDVMTPRVDLIGLDLEHDPSSFVPTVRRAKRSYLLLYRGHLDNVEGFLDARKYLLDPAHRIEAATLPPYYIPENVPLNQLITRFQRDKQRIAVVVDEYGGTAGVITRGDILEEVTGEIYQELSRPRALFQPAGPNVWLVDANFSLNELNRKLDLKLEAEGADRLSGWITAQLGHVPEKDAVVEAQGVRVTVLQTLKLRVTLAQLEKLPPQEESA